MTMSLSRLARPVALAVALLFPLGFLVAPPAAAQEKPRMGGVLNWFDYGDPGRRVARDSRPVTCAPRRAPR